MSRQMFMIALFAFKVVLDIGLLIALVADRLERRRR